MTTTKTDGAGPVRTPKAIGEAPAATVPAPVAQPAKAGGSAPSPGQVEPAAPATSPAGLRTVQVSLSALVGKSMADLLQQAALPGEKPVEQPGFDLGPSQLSLKLDEKVFGPDVQAASLSQTVGRPDTAVITLAYAEQKDVIQDEHVYPVTCITTDSSGNVAAVTSDTRMIPWTQAEEDAALQAHLAAYDKQQGEMATQEAANRGTPGLTPKVGDDLVALVQQALVPGNTPTHQPTDFGMPDILVTQLNPKAFGSTVRSATLQQTIPAGGTVEHSSQTRLTVTLPETPGAVAGYHTFPFTVYTADATGKIASITSDDRMIPITDDR